VCRRGRADPGHVEGDGGPRRRGRRTQHRREQLPGLAPRRPAPLRAHQAAGAADRGAPVSHAGRPHQVRAGGYCARHDRCGVLTGDPQANDIAVTAYSSLGPASYIELSMDRGAPSLLEHGTVAKIASAHGKCMFAPAAPRLVRHADRPPAAPAQILLRWCVCCGGVWHELTGCAPQGHAAQHRGHPEEQQPRPARRRTCAPARTVGVWLMHCGAEPRVRVVRPRRRGPQGDLRAEPEPAHERPGRHRPAPGDLRLIPRR
jgi:hypothetical protein